MTAPNPLTEKPSGAPEWLPAVDDAPSIRRLWWMLGFVLGAGVLAFIVLGSNEPADPELGRFGPSITDASGAPIARQPLPGFGEVAMTVTLADGSVLDWCLLLAQTSEQHARGLMEVTDPALGGYDGMLFRYEEDRTGAFWMRNTPMPLSIAYIAADGTLVSTAEMEPCADDPSCPLYPPSAPYRFTVETPRGGLERLGLLTAGARVEDTRHACNA